MITFNEIEELKKFIRNQISSEYEIYNLDLAVEHALKRYLKYFEASGWKWGDKLTKKFWNKKFCYQAYKKFAYDVELSIAEEKERKRVSRYCFMNDFSDHEMDVYL